MSFNNTTGNDGGGGGAAKPILTPVKPKSSARKPNSSPAGSFSAIKSLKATNSEEELIQMEEYLCQQR